MLPRIRELHLRERLKKLTDVILTKTRRFLLGTKGFLTGFIPRSYRGLKAAPEKGWSRFKVLGLRIKELSWKDFIKSSPAIGLDMGASSIKVVRLIRTRKGVRLIDFLHKEIEREEGGKPSPEAITRAMREIFAEIGKGKIISSLPVSSVITGSLSLPFKEKRKIQQTIRYEAEPYLPFSLEEALVDFYIADRHLPDRTEVVFAALKRKILEETLAILSQAGVEPEIVSLDSIALFNGSMLSGEEGTVILLNLGASQTIMNIVSQGNLRLSRSILSAGDAFTEAITRELRVSFPEAERLKREEADIEKAIAPVLENIAREIEHTLTSFYNYHPDERVSRILLTGGSARLPGISSYLQERLAVDVSFLNPFLERGVSRSQISWQRARELFRPSPSLPEIESDLSEERLGEIVSFVAPALGLARQGLTKAGIALSFIRKEVPLGEKFKELRPLLKWTVLLLLIILLLGTSDFYAHLHLKNKRSRALKREINSIFKKTFPEVKNIVNPLVQMRRKLEGREEELAIPSQSFSPLTLLRELSRSLPSGGRITLGNILIDLGKLEVTGGADSFESVERFRKELETSSYFRKANLGYARLNKDEKGMEFKMTLECGE